MRLGFDLDEVVVNLTAEFEKYLREIYSIEWPRECFVSYNFKDCMFDSDEKRNMEIINDMLSQLLNPNLSESAEPCEGAVHVLNELKRKGHKIYFISSRPKQLQPITFKWLRKYDIPFDGLKLLNNGVPKGLFGRDLYLDMFVDDLESNLESMLKFKKRWRKGLLLMTRPWNYRSIDGSKFLRVDSWEEILRHIGIQNR